MWIDRTGAPWRDLPACYGPVGTVSSRFYRWRKAGIWQRILSDLQAEADQRGEIDWHIHFVDATIVRAHQHAAGVRRDGATGKEAQVREALGRSQGGFSTKLHLRAEGNGRPITVVLTAASAMNRSRWKRCSIKAPSGVLDAVAHVCARAGSLATRATAARALAPVCGDATSGR